MADNSQGDLSERVPGLRGLSARSRQLVLLILALIVMLGLGVLLFFNSLPSAGRSAAPGASASVSSVDPGDPSGPGASAPPDDQPGSASGSAEPSESAAPEPSGPSTTEGEQGPVSVPTGGELEPAEEKRVTTLINTVVPTWSEADFASEPGTSGDDREARDLTRKWVAGWRNEDQVTANFTNASTARFTEIWGGAIQMAATVSDAKIISAKLVDNYGAESYWTVDVERTVTAPGVKQIEQMTWYFMIKNGADGPLLDEFYLPSDLATDDHQHEGGHDG
jgi:hypothetical protein